jgi:phage shock protein C
MKTRVASEGIVNSQKRLYRSTQERMLAGVCGGIADYLDVDPTLVRLVFVALALLSSGSGLVIYLILMLIVPTQPEEKRKLKQKRKLKNEDIEARQSVVRSSIAVDADEVHPPSEVVPPEN